MKDDDVEALARAAKAGCEIHGKSHDRIVSKAKDRAFRNGYWTAVAVVVVSEVVTHLVR